MQIQNGKLYENRTWKYLYPCLKHYGEELNKYLSSFLKLAIGLGDNNVEKDEDFNSIYILLDTNLPLSTGKARQEYKDKLSKFLDWVSYQDYYISDYIFDTSMHMVVLKIPEEHNNSYFHFIKGEFSEMYNPKSITKYFKYISIPNKELELRHNNKLKDIKSVFNKDKKYIHVFVNRVNKDFNTDVGVEYFQEAELDYPLKKKEEIFNYKEGEL